MLRANNKLVFKLRHLYLPLIGASIAVLGAYSLLNWSLDGRTVLIPLTDDVVDYWLPLGISGIVVLAVALPRFNLFRRDGQWNLSPIYYLAAIAMAAVPTIVAQSYIRTTNGRMAHLNDLGEIAVAPVSKFYIVDKVCVDYPHTLIHPRVHIGRGQTVLVDDYGVAPACGNKLATLGDHTVWIALKAHTSFLNTLSEAEKESLYAGFLHQADLQFRSENPNSYQFLERIGRSTDAKGYIAALQNTDKSVAVDAALVLIPHKEKFADRAGDRLPWVFGSFAIGAVVWLPLILLRPLDPKKISRWRKLGGKHPMTAGALALLVPTRKSFGLPLLLDANLVVFLAMVVGGAGFTSFETQDLIAWGGNYPPALHGVGFLRLISNQFVHAGILHLVNNLYGLLVGGIFLVPIIRNAGLVVCYLLAGLGASIASAAVHPYTVSVGASGAIFGLFGILLTLSVLRDPRLELIRKPVLINAAIFITINLLIGWGTPGIDNAAHLGGLATGVLLGLIIRFAVRSKSPVDPTTKL